MGRRPCCSKVGLNRGAWTAQEDKLLSDFIKIHGEGKWRNVPIKAGLKRCGKSCRLRWLNYLKPDIKRGNITHDEEELIIKLHGLLGKRWSLIAKRLPGRTDNEIKNYWNTILARRVHHDEHGKSKDKSKKTEAQDLETSNEKAIPEVRAKAARCSNAFITNIAQNQRSNAPSKDGSDEQKEQEKPSSDQDFSSGGSEAKNPSDSGDYAMEQLQFSDLLSLESSSWHEFDYVNYSNKINVDDDSYLLDSPLFLYDEMLLQHEHDWSISHKY